MPPKNKHEDELNAADRKKNALVDWFRSRKSLQTMNVLEISVQNDWNSAKELRPGGKFKDLVKELVDEGRLKSKKCGAQTIVYIFESSEVSTIVNGVKTDSNLLDKHKSQLHSLQQEYQQLMQVFSSSMKDQNEINYQSQLLDQLSFLRQNNHQLQQKTSQYAENDPEFIQELKILTFLSYHAVNIITKNIALLTRFLTRQFTYPSHLPPFSPPTRHLSFSSSDASTPTSSLTSMSDHLNEFQNTQSTSYYHQESIANISPEDLLSRCGIDMFSFDFLSIPHSLQVEIAYFLLNNHSNDLSSQNLTVLRAVTTLGSMPMSSTLSTKTPAPSVQKSPQLSLQQNQHKQSQSYAQKPQRLPISSQRQSPPLSSMNDDDNTTSCTITESREPNQTPCIQSNLPQVITQPIKRRFIIRKKIAPPE